MTNQKNAVKLKSLYTGLVIRHLLQFHEPENIFAFRLKTFDKNAKQSKHLNFFRELFWKLCRKLFCLKLASLADFSSSSLRNVLTIAAEAVCEGGCLRSLFLIARRTVACNKIRQIIVSIPPHRRADRPTSKSFSAFLRREKFHVKNCSRCSNMNPFVGPYEKLEISQCVSRTDTPGTIAPKKPFSHLLHEIGNANMRNCFLVSGRHCNPLRRNFCYSSIPFLRKRLSERKGRLPFSRLRRVQVDGWIGFR